MGFFSRRRPDGANAGPVNGHQNGPAFDTVAYPMATRPSFGQWLKVTWIDIVTMICMGAIGLGVYEAHPAPTRSFPVTFSDGEVVYPEFAYPLRKEIIPIWLAAFLAAVIPIVIILLMQIRVRSFWDVNNAVIGLLYSLITAAVFQVFLKWLIGGLRPHFLDVCKPDISLASNAPGVKGVGYNAAGFNGIYYTKEICTGDSNEINDSLESFPSGHSTAAFAGFIYLSIYLNAKLKVFANYHPAMWKLIAVYAPVLGATLIAGALTIDEFHNWYDVVAGGIIGSVMAFSAYRMCYASIWDWRWNHVPLHRGQPCLYTYDGVELMDAMWTRRAGWGAGAGAVSGFGGTGRAANERGGVGTFPRKPVGGGTARRGDDMV
ncbi:acid phosphatase/Vanadium-dependent haloperoxidase [Annulohypoxylon maeteangense]|uniref:acid phosphatase/Vanadium-dependent haloperoxidase n=1 Tax=Annulohypoxylon maeteangense TaxID=1927788 RepID=UPI002008C4F9|nr:acid phosphatase/Vanadium-dependent haloperoxidase [Annulohypoxylon maeteangense]KAI0883104.1 acid phosphatase/Vanadium-dependent haloperoxidase [Annulohypoxylon maeteangense]